MKPAYEILSRIEWEGLAEEADHYTADTMIPCCPYCYGLEPGSHNQYELPTEGELTAAAEGHTKDCELAELMELVKP